MSKNREQTLYALAVVIVTLLALSSLWVADVYFTGGPRILFALVTFGVAYVIVLMLVYKSESGDDHE